MLKKILTIKRKTAMRLVMTLIIIFSLILCSLTNFWFGLAFWLLCTTGFIKQGIKEVPAKPPSKGSVTRFGKRIQEKIKKRDKDGKIHEEIYEEIVDEGYRFFPFYPYWFGFIQIIVKKINQDFTPSNVRTPKDRAALNIRPALTFTPTHLVEYQNTGGEEGVMKIFDDIVPERVREWAWSENEGPQTWDEAQGAREDLIAILLKKIVGEGLTEIPEYAQEFPTPIWLKYFSKPRKKLTIEKDIDVAGQKWEKVEEFYFKKLLAEQRIELYEAATKRKQEIEKVRAGNGNFVKPMLGVTINRLNVPDIILEGETAKAAEREAVEIQERKGEIYEVETDLMKAEQLKEKVNANLPENQKITLVDAYHIIMDYKTAREGHGFTLPGFSPAIAKLVETILGRRDK